MQFLFLLSLVLYQYYIALTFCLRAYVYTVFLLQWYSCVWPTYLAYLAVINPLKINIHSCNSGCSLNKDSYKQWKGNRFLCTKIWYVVTQSVKKQCGGVYFCLYCIAYWMPIQQKLTPPELLLEFFSQLLHFFEQALEFSFCNIRKYIINLLIVT